MSEQKSNVRLYRDLSEPFPSVDAANEAMRAFFHDLGELRAKHKLRDVYTIVSVNAMTDEGEGQFCSRMMLGFEGNALGMIAEAYGREREAYEARVARLLKG